VGRKSILRRCKLGKKERCAAILWTFGASAEINAHHYASSPFLYSKAPLKMYVLGLVNDPILPLKRPPCFGVITKGVVRGLSGVSEFNSIVRGCKPAA
jgi:hypothetical protein